MMLGKVGVVGGGGKNNLLLVLVLVLLLLLQGGNATGAGWKLKKERKQRDSLGVK